MAKGNPQVCITDNTTCGVVYTKASEPEWYNQRQVDSINYKKISGTLPDSYMPQNVSYSTK